MEESVELFQISKSLKTDSSGFPLGAQDYGNSTTTGQTG